MRHETIESIKYTFSESEKRQLSQEMSERVIEAQEIEDEKKAVASSYKKRADACTMMIRTLARKVKDGYEYRSVSCEMIFDRRSGEVHYYRLDTGEHVRSRQMTPEERQMSIDEMLPEDDEPSENSEIQYDA